MSSILLNRQKSYPINTHSWWKRKIVLFSLISLLVSFIILILTTSSARLQLDEIIHFRTPLLVSIKAGPPKWLEAIRVARMADEMPLKVGLINLEHDSQFHLSLHGVVESFNIGLKQATNVTWNELFPEINNGSKRGTCPKIPMPDAKKYPRLDIVVARLPCSVNESHKMEGIRDVHRLQLSLAMARVIVENSISNERGVYGVFIMKCEPMVEIFRCDDLIWHEGEYWVYKPKVEKLREKVSMPVGACDLARPYVGDSGFGKLEANSSSSNQSQQKKQLVKNKSKQAYVTVLHSSEEYVCGAIALAQSILQTNTTNDLILLADREISNHSITSLQAGGWKIKYIERIRSPYANITDYNAWNYSKLRIWQLIEYDKVMFIDSDFIVLRNIDHFFNYPQLSAAPNGNDKGLFNSGIILLEPSKCMFDTLMKKRYALMSYNGGDQGYLNEIFTYWHRLSNKLNFLKYFFENVSANDRVFPKDHYTIHFLGMKPWTCYRDYDCNWDRSEYRYFASDDVHSRWWHVYDAMSKELQVHCGMTKVQDGRLRQRRVWAKMGNFSDGHWKIELKDPRQFKFVTSA